jgi:hypothetical protein
MERLIVSGAFADKARFYDVLHKQLSTHDFYKTVYDRRPRTLLELESQAELMDKETKTFMQPERLEGRLMIQSLEREKVDELMGENTYLDQKIDFSYDVVHDKLWLDSDSASSGIVMDEKRLFYALMQAPSAMVSFLDIHISVKTVREEPVLALAYAAIRGPLARLRSPLVRDVRNYFNRCGLQLINDKVYAERMNTTFYPSGSLASEAVDDFIARKKISGDNCLIKVVDE